MGLSSYNSLDKFIVLIVENCLSAIRFHKIEIFGGADCDRNESSPVKLSKMGRQ